MVDNFPAEAKLSMERKAWAWLVVLLLGAAGCKGKVAPAVEDTEKKEFVVRVGSFGGLGALPLGLGDAQGLYAAWGLAVEVEWFRRADDLTAALVKGDIHVAHAPADALVSLVDEKGADGILVMGGSDGMNELVVRPEVKSLRGLSGKTILVDPGNPAYSLLLQKVLLSEGLVAERDYKLAEEGASEKRIDGVREKPDQAATLLAPPATFAAEKVGLKSLGPLTRTMGPYQGLSAMVMRPWAQANPEVLSRYLASWVQGLRFALARENQGQVLTFLTEKMHLKPEVAAQTYALLASGKSGLAVDAQFDEPGFRNALAIRAEMQKRGKGKAPPAERYFDLSYYRVALAALDKSS